VLVFIVPLVWPKSRSINEVEVKHKSLIAFGQPDPITDSKQKDEFLFISQHSSKAHVMCGAFLLAQQFLYLFLQNWKVPNYNTPDNIVGN
jgi:hypothetical protein